MSEISKKDIYNINSIDSYKDVANKIAKTMNISLPSIFYRYGIHECWKCDKIILVFAWPEGNMLEPIPKTIKKVSSPAANEEYYGNICPYCDSLQGKFFLYHEPDGPFYGLTCRSNTIENFEKDLNDIYEYLKMH